MAFGALLLDLLKVVVGLVIGVIIGFFVARKIMKKQLKENPPKPKPTQVELLQAQIDELQKEKTLQDIEIKELSDRNNFNEDLIAELAMEVYA